MAEEIKFEKRKLLIRRGEFRCLKNSDMLTALVLAGAVFTAVALVLACIIEGFGVLLGASLFLLLILVILRLAVGSSDLYRYEANETEFVVTDRNGERRFFYYNDIKNIEFLPFRHKKRGGFEVTVTTSLREYTYKYLVGEDRYFAEPEGTAFYYLAYNAGLADSIPKSTADPRKIMNQFENMQRSQQRSKKGSKRLQTVQQFLDKYDK